MRNFNNIILLLSCIAAPLMVGFWGIDRPYDAIPDQDLLWASEALRLLRGVGPSYADHPGVFWSLAYIVNIKLSQFFQNSGVIDQSGSITSDGLSLVIRLARIENAVASGLCSYLVYQVSRSLNTVNWLAALAALLTSTSTALLISVSEIRHEAISVAFILLSIVSYHKALKSAGGIKIAFAALATLSPLLAAFCKNQVLILTPLLAAAIAYIYLQNRTERAVNEKHLNFLQPKPIASYAAYASFIWILAAVPDIDLVNLPFWAAINLTLAAILSTATRKRNSFASIQKSFLIIGAAEILIFKFISPGWWRQAVTGFPSWMFRYANTAEDSSTSALNQLWKGGSLYLSNSFPPTLISATAITTSIIASAALLCALTKRKEPFTDVYQFLNGASWLLAGTVLFIVSQRIASRYEIYFFIPYILLSTKSLSSFKLATPSIGRPICAIRSLQAISAVLLLSATLASARNLGDLKSFVNPGQDRGNLCIGHHMDRTMKNTSAATCKVFTKAILDKNPYDPWRGPK